MEKYLLLLSFITAVYSQSFTPGSLDTFVLNEHNRYRRMENAANMKKMVWSDKLARVAQSWADTCRQAHQNIGYGENLYWHTKANYPVKDLTSQGMKAWYDEKSLWSWGQGFSSATGHYTQMVWAKTDKVGCGIRTDCPAQGSFTRPYLFLACFYDPPGNFGNENPYKQGTPCSSCPGQCDQGLCTGSTTDDSGSTNDGGSNNNNNDGNTWDNNNNDGNTWDNNNNDGNTWDNNNNDNWWDNNNDGNTWDNNNNNDNWWDNNDDGNTWDNNNNDNWWDNNNDGNTWDNNNNDNWWDNNNDGNTWDNNNNDDWNSWDDNNNWDSWDNNWWKRGKIVRRQPASLGSHGNRLMSQQEHSGHPDTNHESEKKGQKSVNRKLEASSEKAVHMKTNRGKHIAQLPVEMKRKAILRKLESVKKERKNQLLARKLVAALKSLSKNK